MKKSIILSIALFIIFSFFSDLFAQKYAKSVVCSLIGGKTNKNTNVDLVLGAPDTPNPSDPDAYNTNNVSLGGGFIIIEMEVEVIDGNGDDLIVYEIGKSYKTAFTESFYVKGSKDMSSGNWIYLGEYKGDVCRIDFKKYNANNLRYFAIFDGTKTPDEGSMTPGADIDAVEAINFK